MARNKRGTTGNLAIWILGVGSAVACVSGSTPDQYQGDDEEKAPTCYSNANCPPSNECSGGECVPVTICGDANGCRPGEACIEGGCRAPCAGTMCANDYVCEAGYCMPKDPPPPPPTGGTNAGGAASGGVAGANGGQPAGGSAGSGVGGAGNESGMGGAFPTGGALPTGGTDTGGAFPTGGTETGGAFPTGGTATGGTNTGGTATGGKGGTATGGTATGGTSTGGTGTGGSATGGTGNVAGATACSIGDAHNGNGSFTWYNFAQGTYREGDTYVTACGYRGTAAGTVDTVQNISNTSPASNQYFVAIPSNSDTDFNTSQYCGACVELTGQNGTKIVATVIDACPRTGPVTNPRCTDGHLDVSKTAFDRLGFSRGDPGQTTWRFVPCPVGNMKVNTRMKSGNNNEFFVEGGITAITQVSVNGTMATRTSYGAWHINSAVPGGAMLTLTDRGGNGRATLTVPLNNGSTANQDSGKQFQGCN